MKATPLLLALIVVGTPCAWLSLSLTEAVVGWSASASLSVASGGDSERVELPKTLRAGPRRAACLVIALHGGSWNHKSSEELARGLLNELEGPAKRAGVRLLVPILPDAARDWRGSTPSPEGTTIHDGRVPWMSPPAEAALLALIEAELGRGVDPERVGLAGHGAGGTAALLLTARHPERFNGVALWSSSPSPLWDAEGRVVGLVEDPVPRLSGLGLFLYTSDDDAWLDREALRRLERSWEAQLLGKGGRALIRERGSGGHGFGKRGALNGLRALASWRGHLRARGPSRSRS